MKKTALALASLFIAFNAHAINERDASKVVKKYSETIACQLADARDQKNQYKAIRISHGIDEKNGITIGASFLVYWEGDIGCEGGNGTISPNFTLVGQRGFSSVPPVIDTEFKSPLLDLHHLTSFSVKNDVIYVEGLTYSGHDQPNVPTKAVKYELKFSGDSLIPR